MKLIKPVQIAPKKKSIVNTKQKQKLALIKRSQIPKRLPLNINDRIVSIINHELKNIKIITDEQNISDPKEIERRSLALKSEIITNILKNSVLPKEFLMKHWPKEFNAITKKDEFGWMFENKQIAKILKKHKNFVPILKMLQKMTNRAKNNNIENCRLSKGKLHISIQPKRIDGKVLKNNAGEIILFRSDWPISALETNSKFYKDISKLVGCSISTVHREIKIMLKLRSVKVVNVLRSNVKVISCGFYSESPVGKRHINYMTRKAFETTLEKGF